MPLLSVPPNVQSAGYWIHRLFNQRPLLKGPTAGALPTKTEIDPRLVLGAALFGAGWGLGGLCPGPALTNLGSCARPACTLELRCPPVELRCTLAYSSSCSSEEELLKALFCAGDFICCPLKLCWRSFLALLRARCSPLRRPPFLPALAFPCSLSRPCGSCVPRRSSAPSLLLFCARLVLPACCSVRGHFRLRVPRHHRRLRRSHGRWDASRGQGIRGPPLPSSCPDGDSCPSSPDALLLTGGVVGPRPAPLSQVAPSAMKKNPGGFAASKTA